MRGTKLWQQAGSPIIQGRSRTAKPFWADAVRALLFGIVLCVAIALLAARSLEGGRLLDQMLLLGRPLVLFGILPSLAAVWLSRSLRAGTPWVVGGLVSAGLTLAGLAVVWGR